MADRKVRVSSFNPKLGKIDITETLHGKKAIKIIQGYEAFLDKELARGDLRKTDSFKKWVTKEYGEAAYKSIADLTTRYTTVEEFYTPSRSKNRNILLERAIVEANKGDKYVSQQDINLKAKAYPSRPPKHVEKKYNALLHTEADKIRKAFDKIVDSDEVIKWPSKYTKKGNIKNPLFAMINSRTGAGGGGHYITQVLGTGKTSRGDPINIGIYKPKHTYPRELLKLAGTTGVIEYEKPLSEILAEAKYREGGGLVWSQRNIRPDPATSINDFALRHWVYHKRNKTNNSQIEFFWKNKKDAQGNPLHVEYDKVPRDKFGSKKGLKTGQVFFKYTEDPLQREWDLTKIRRDGKDSKLFNEVYVARNEYNKLLSKRVPDPRTGKIISFEELMKRTYKKGFGHSPSSEVYGLDHEKLVADKPFNALRVASQRLNNQLSYISRHAKQKNFKKILTDALDLKELDDPLKAGKRLAEKVLVEGYKTPLDPVTGKMMTGPQELSHQVLKKDLDKLSRPMTNQLVNLFSRSPKEGIVRPIIDAAGLKGAKICGIIFGKGGQRFGTAAGGVPGYPNGCVDEVNQALDENPDELFKKVADIKQKGGALGRASNWAKQILSKVPKGGRLGAILAGAGAVGAGTYAMMGDAEAEETQTTDQDTMKYNSTTGTFDNMEGDPVDQQSKLNWIAENPIKAGLTALPAFMGVGYGLSAAGMKAAGKTGAALKGVGQHLMSWKAIIPAMMIPEKMHQWKTGMEAGEMITDPFNAIWALGIRSSGEMAAVKAYYDTLPTDARFSLKGLKSAKGWKDLPKAFRGALMSPAAKGTDLAFQKRLKPALKKLTESIIGSPFAKETAKKGLGALAKRAAIGVGAAALLPATVAAGLVSAPLTLGLGALSFGYAQYKDYRDGKAIVDGMRAKGKISEEDADKYMSLIKQGSLPFGLGNRLFGDDEMTIRGQNLNPEQQRGLLAGMEDQIDLFQDRRKEVRALDREDDFDFFSEGGRVGMKFGGGMDRRGFLKWLATLGATIAGGASGIFKTGAKKGIEQVVKQAPKKFIGVEGMPAWFPRAVQKIKTHGKLIEMADKHYVNGDIYEMILPTKVPKFDMVAGQQKMSGFQTVNKKVRLEENPISGEIEMTWKVDDFDGEMTRQINFKPGESGFQRFGADPEHPGAWEFQRVKVEEPEFTYGNPDQSTPERSEFDYKDIFTEGDDVVKALEDLTGNKKMVAQDGSIIETTDASGVDEAFQKKIFKDIEGEGQIIPDAEGHMTPDGWSGDKGNEIIGGDVPSKLYKKAGGGTVETGDIARRQSLVPPLAGPDPQGIMGLYSEPKQVRVG